MSNCLDGKNLAHPDYHNLGYEAIWKSVRAVKRFTNNSLIIHIGKTSTWGINDWTVKAYVRALHKAGFIKITGEGKHRANIYELVKDCGAEAPRLRKDGTRATAGTKYENLWRSMRMLKTFDILELVLTASANGVTVSELTAKDYVKDLRTAGYIKTLPKSGQTSERIKYRLVKNTGPKPPAVRKVNQVYDRNLKEIVWPKKEPNE
ncbi:MAG: hypothetical protein CMI13_04240 [Oleibacter sp.]|nr:hypothetical protein [Thalassolituus sp.]|tara:strand:- start:4403 stop:5020 length:618 start_codon:yes stop_codon:yes gene_type:complete